MHRKLVFASAAMLGMAMSGARADGNTGSGARVLEGGSSAQVRRNRLVPWRKLGTGAVPEGAELSCEERCRVKVDADNVVTLTPGAIVLVGSVFHVPMGSRDALVPAHEVELHEGRNEALSPSARGMPLVVSAFGSSHVA